MDDMGLGGHIYYIIISNHYCYNIFFFLVNPGKLNLLMNIIIGIDIILYFHHNIYAYKNMKHKMCVCVYVCMFVYM